jgi:methanogenic corrinoid protein MtbC1
MEAPSGHEGERLRRLRAIGRLREAYADAILVGDEPAAEQAIREAIDVGMWEAVIDDAIITPAMRRVGELWAAGTLSIAEEQRATAITLRMIALQRESFRVTASRPGHRVLLCGLEAEQHHVGLEMAASVLQHAGYDVHLLGADVAITALGPEVERRRPAIVGFSATLAATAALLPAAIYAVRAAHPTAGIMVGGPAATLRMEATPGVSVCTHVTDAVELADALVQRADLN